jgi:hypothetical protein
LLLGFALLSGIIPGIDFALILGAKNSGGEENVSHFRIDFLRVDHGNRYLEEQESRFDLRDTTFQN